MQHDNISAADRVNFAKSEGIDSALRDYVETGGALEKAPNIKRRRQTMLEAPRAPRFDVPKLDINLRDWQVDLLARLNCQPVSRRIFWCSGPSGSGKTTFTSYLEQIMKVAH